MRGMKRASQHRQDRMSASLHLVDESDAGRFGDAEPQKVKGLVMPQQGASRARQEAERIQRVRSLRRAAARRRRILAVLLLIATVAVGVCSYTMSFSPLFSLIPLGLLALVLALGARAAAQARKWEVRLAQRQRAQRSQQAQALKAAQGVQAARLNSQAAGKDAAAYAGNETTAALSQQDIRAAILQSRQDQQLALAARSAQQAQEAAAARLEAAQERQTRQADAVPVEQAAQAEQTQDSVQLQAGQTLYSFSMGEPRQGQVPAVAEPESREIKSSKQVARAVPKAVSQSQQDQAAKATASAQAEKGLSAGLAGQSGRPTDFHQREVQADVDAPALSEDSLGKVGVEAILARRTRKQS
ncbi:hypothetical protein KIM372_03110 [Bombiscardovia nodaiensis]|uniref:Uncharacterized protein n=1 Tax=Bombiscardovia nodaiensis TaxID=2932181 RepID=A0ABN6SAG8_9BIFI|nr:hypothetical protein KIM372_03110 [Bombiscardovia nodaiensis]